MKKKIGRLLIFASLFPLASARAVSDRAVRLTASEPSAVMLEMNLPLYRIQEAPGGRRFVREIKVDGWGSIGQIGDPKLPMTAALIEVPGPGSCRLSIVSSSYETIYGYEASPVEKETPWNSGDPASGDVSQSEAFSLSSFYPGLLARISGTLRMRGIPTARILFFPFQWNPATRELRVHQKILVRVDFEGVAEVGTTAVSPVEDEFSHVVRESIIGPSIPRFQSPHPRPARSIRGSSWKKRLRLDIEESGVYFLGYDDIVDAGLNPGSLHPASFRLLCQDREVAFVFRGRNGTVWSPGDYLEFYGKQIDSLYTETNTYWLDWEANSGVRMSRRSVPYAASGERVTSFREKIVLEENVIPWGLTPGAPSTDYWFWARMTAPADLSIPFTLPEDTFIDSHTARIQAEFQGRSTAAPHPNHRTSLTLNEFRVSDEKWDGDRVYDQTVDIPQTRLQRGANILRVVAMKAASVDVSYFNRVRIEYWRGLNARHDEILFSPDGAGRRSFEINGFSGGEILAYEVSDPDHPVELTDFAVVETGGGRGVRFDAVTEGTERFFFLTRDRIRRVSKAEIVEVGALSWEENRADVIVIAPRELRKAAGPLLVAQASRRLRPFFAAVEDIYNEFASGIPDPAAIKAFLKHTYEKWGRPAPLHVLLMGDATYDYKNYLKQAKTSQVPVHLSWTHSTGITADDNWYACVDGDDELPDVFIGRIPGGAVDKAGRTTKKLAAFEMRRTALPKQVLLVSDDGDYQFEMINDQIIPLLLPGFAARKIYLSAYPDKNQASRDLLAAINGGLFLVNFAGHGNVTLWTGELILDNPKVEELSNRDHLALFCAYTCNNGYFAGPAEYSLAETLIAADDKGAFGFFAATGSDFPWVHEIIAEETMKNVFRSDPGSLGAILTKSKIEAFSRGAAFDALRMFTLFGDPSLRLEIR